VILRARVVAPVLLVGLSSTPAFAQAPQPPPRPIFGGGISRIAQSLVLGGSLGQSFFRTERRLAGEESDTRVDSQFTSASGSLTYGLEGTRAGASASLSSSANYYEEVSDEIIRGYGGAVGAWLRISNRTRLDGSHAVTYQPAFQNAFQQLLDPSFVPIVPPTDVAASDERWLSHDSRIALSHQLSRRSSLSFDAGRREVDFSGSEGRQLQYSAGARYTHQLSAGLGFRLGYRYSTGDASGDASGRAGFHTIDAGLDFSRSFSITRRTTLGVSTGSSVVQTADDTTQFFVTGSGTLSQRLGRTWSASVTGGRDVSFVDGLGDPVLSDRLMAGVNGNLGRRVRAQAAANAIRGQVLAGADEDETYLVYTANTGISVALARAVSWTVSYAYQESDFGEVDFLVTQQLQAYHAATTGVAISPWRYLSFNVNYSYTTVARGRSETAPPKYRRHSVVFSIGTSLPLFATVRK
jgi:hypothetical protein